MLHNHLHHRQVWYHIDSNYVGDIQEGYHLAKDEIFEIYLLVWYVV